MVDQVAFLAAVPVPASMSFKMLLPPFDKHPLDATPRIAKPLSFRTSSSFTSMLRWRTMVNH